jgi:hypothetical protein
MRPRVDPDGDATMAHFDATVAPHRIDDLRAALEAYHARMSDYVARYREEYASLAPLPITVRRWTAWVIWLVVVPVIILCAIQLFS